jgi:hypothetical protein
MPFHNSLYFLYSSLHHSWGPLLPRSSNLRCDSTTDSTWCCKGRCLRSSNLRCNSFGGAAAICSVAAALPFGTAAAFGAAIPFRVATTFFFPATFTHFPTSRTQTSAFHFFAAFILASVPGSEWGPQATPAFLKTRFNRPPFGRALMQASCSA